MNDFSAFDTHYKTAFTGTQMARDLWLRKVEALGFLVDWVSFRVQNASIAELDVAMEFRKSDDRLNS